MKPNLRTFTILFLSVLMLCGCKPTLIVTLFSPQERVPAPRFRIEDPSKPGDRPRYDTIKLSDAQGEIIWHLRAEPFGDENSVESFSYATTPRGFSVVIAPKPLEPNHDYILGVIGKAFGTLRIHVDADGRVHPVQ